jgi:SAM-dependent methyltransferase
LPQHLGALMLLQQRLSSPDAGEVSWLDLACGKGQIVLQLDQNVAPQLRSKLVYYGYDLKLEHVNITEAKVATLALRSVTVKVGDLPDFTKAFDREIAFDFVTLTNTLHEIEPRKVAAILFDALSRLSNRGLLFVYDMEQLEVDELGAVPWRSSEIEILVATLLSNIGVTRYSVTVSRWRHSRVDGWSLMIEHEHIVREAPNYRERRDDAIRAVSEKAREILSSRLQVCTAALESLTKHGSATGAEKVEETASLYEFWALMRALGSANE